MPVETSFPFTGISYSAGQVAAALASVMGTGIVTGYAQALQVVASSPNAMTVEVEPGEAWINGVFYNLASGSGNKVLSIASNVSGNSRIDRVVIGLNYTTSTVTLYVKAGTPAATPVPPALEQDALVYELSLAQVLVASGASSLAASALTDERGVTAPFAVSPGALPLRNPALTQLPSGQGGVQHVAIGSASLSGLTVPTISSVAGQSPTAGHSAITGMTSHIYVEVTAVDVNGHETAGSAAVTGTPTGGQDALATWASILNAVSYNVYVSTGASDPGDASRWYAGSTAGTTFEISGALPTFGQVVPAGGASNYTVPTGYTLLVSRGWATTAGAVVNVNRFNFLNLGAAFAAVMTTPIPIGAGMLVSCPRYTGLWGYLVPADPAKTIVIASLPASPVGTVLYAIPAYNRFVLLHAYCGALQTLYDSINGNTVLHFATMSQESGGADSPAMGWLRASYTPSVVGLPQPIIIPGTAAGANVQTGIINVAITVVGFIEATPNGA